MKSIESYWYSQNPVAWLLLPVTAVYFIIVVVRRFLYKIQWLKSYRSSVPVIIVGNISVGGTGKTPLLITLYELLTKQGYRPGVIRRGYGGDFEGEHQVASDDQATIIGDEPYLIFRRTACPMVVVRDRVAAAHLLLSNSDCDIILSDDGLQHYRLQRDIEIAVVDTSRQFGNGFCLPSGPLRETRARLNQVDFVVDHCTDKNSRCSQDNFSLQFLNVINLKTGEEKSVKDFLGQPVHAVAGIGHPQRFFDQLKSNVINVIEHAYPDHYNFVQADVSFDDTYPVLMTEKDAVKCQGFDASHLWTVPVTAKLSEHLDQHFLSKIKSLKNE